EPVMAAFTAEGASHPVAASGRGRWLLAGIVGLCCAIPAHAAESERLFQDGFDPCCRLGGTISGLIGDSLVLHLSAGPIEEDRAISASNGAPRPYDFAASVSGGPFSVSILSQPVGQTCSLVNASGTVGSTAIDDIDASCVNTPGLIWDHGNWDAADWQ